MTSVAAYEHLEAHWRRLSHIGDAISALHWDQSVMMPPGGAAARADQIATLSVLRHDVMVDPKIEEHRPERCSNTSGKCFYRKKTCGRYGARQKLRNTSQTHQNV